MCDLINGEVTISDVTQLSPDEVKQIVADGCSTKCDPDGSQPIYVHWYQRDKQIALFLLRIAFDAATWEVWGALLNGACVLLIPEQALLNRDSFQSALQRGRASALFLTTALMNQ